MWKSIGYKPNAYVTNVTLNHEHASFLCIYLLCRVIEISIFMMILATGALSSKFSAPRLSKVRRHSAYSLSAKLLMDFLFSNTYLWNRTSPFFFIFIHCSCMLFLPFFSYLLISHYISLKATTSLTLCF